MIILANATATASSTNLVNSGFFWAETFALTISALIGIAATLLVQRWLNAPKIRGGIYGIVHGDWNFSKTETNLKAEKTFFCPYVYLTNQHRNAIWPLDYECEVDCGEGYVKLERVYGDLTQLFPPTMDMDASLRSVWEGKPLEIHVMKNHVLYAKAKAIRYGEMLQGFVMFSGDLQLSGKTVLRAKFTCIDAFQKRHTFEAGREEFLNAALFYELLELSP
jgi:hypothetical protein